MSEFVPEGKGKGWPCKSWVSVVEGRLGGTLVSWRESRPPVLGWLEWSVSVLPLWNVSSALTVSVPGFSAPSCWLLLYLKHTNSQRLRTLISAIQFSLAGKTTEPGIMGQAFHKGEQQGKKVTGNQEASHLSPCLWRLEVLIQNNLLWRIWGPCIAQAQWERKGRAAPTALQSLSLRDRGHHRCPFGWDCDGDVTPLSWDWAVDL